MKTLLVAAAAALGLASLAGCDDYYAEGRAPATAYGQSTAYYDETQTTGATVDPTLAVSAEAAPVGGSGGQDVVIGASADEYSDTDPSALSDFHSTLDPYGSWVDDPSYGTVWVPSAGVVGSDFTPYVSSGHWAYDNDYVWVSDYEWGWAPFHYGRWTYIGNRGWGWIPGRTYAGAWVNWRTGYDGWGYVGWAPTPPSWYWRGGYAVGIGTVPYAPYTFCTHGDLFAPSIAGRVVAGQQVASIASHTRPYTPANPGVGGPGRTPASPGVGGSRSGPPPSQLGIASNQVTRAPVQQDRGLMRANQFARPSTATSLGARAPATFASSNANTFRPSSTVATSPSYNRPTGTPQYRSVPFGSTPSYRTAPTRSYTAPSYSHSYTAPSYSHSYSAPSYSHSYSAPSYSHSAPSYSAPSHSYGGGGGGSHSGYSGSRSSGGGGRGGGRR